MKHFFHFNIICFAITALTLSNVNAQEAKGVKSVIEYSVESKGGKAIETKKATRQFDKNGNLIEEIDYDEFGNEKQHVKYEYNAKNLKVKEISILASDKIDEISVYEYDEKGSRISKTVTDGSGKLKSKKRFSYEYY